MKKEQEDLFDVIKNSHKSSDIITVSQPWRLTALLDFSNWQKKFIDKKAKQTYNKNNSRQDGIIYRNPAPAWQKRTIRRSQRY